MGRKQRLETLVREIEDSLGPVHILVNNSGLNVGQGAALDVTVKMFDRIFEVTVKATPRLVRLIVPGMIARETGSVINVVSVGGLQPFPGGLLT